MTLAGRRILVSGGASGIGRATTLVLADGGAHVVVLDVDEGAGRSLARDAGASGGEVSFLRVDVAVEPEVAAAVGQAASSLGGLDVVISAAGIMRGQLEPIEEHDEATWDAVVDVNLKGAFLLSKHSVRVMLAVGRGVIILVGSKSGVSVGSGSFSYGASKGGIHGLTLALDRRLGPLGIRVNEVCPGDVDTPLYRRSIEEGIEQGADRDAAEARLAHLATPDSVARVIAFLASDEAAAVRGTIFTA